jgi:hypothetical protein
MALRTNLNRTIVIGDAASTAKYQEARPRVAGSLLAGETGAC